jgi:hypothetical protein
MAALPARSHDSPCSCLLWRSSSLGRHGEGAGVEHIGGQGEARSRLLLLYGGRAVSGPWLADAGDSPAR